MNEESENTERVLCPSCMSENLPTVDFCEKCGCPIGQFVNLDPLKRIYSQGWLYRRSASGRIPPIVLLGMWLIFGIGLATSVLTMVHIGFSDAVYSDQLVWFNLPFVLLCAAILYRVTKNYLRCRGSDRTNEDENEKT
jgi:hypothetical protein